MVPAEDLTVAVRKQLDRLLAAEVFDGQDRKKQFLRFVVEETLAGRGGDLKEMLIGVVVFGRGDDYDPRLDATVRVEATKLRKRLAEYYDGPGANDPVILTIPKGGYVPHWINREAVAPSAVEEPAGAETPQSPRFLDKRIFLAAIALIALIGAYAFYQRPQRSSRLPQLTRVTYDDALAITPAISRDGELLAYASNRSGANGLNIWVRPLAGGDPIQLSDLPGDEFNPDFSSDGARIAFQNQTESGVSLYVAPSQGGQPPRLLAAQGDFPRFSPTGIVLVYSILKQDRLAGEPGAGDVMILGADGVPRKLCETFHSSRSAVWSPDGKYLVFLGYPNSPDQLDWYITPSDRCEAVSTGFASMLRKNEPPTAREAGGWHSSAGQDLKSWQNDRIYFVRDKGGLSQIWSVRMNTATKSVEGLPEPVTTGPMASVQPAAGPAGSLAYSVMDPNIGIFSIAISTETGEVMGEPERLTGQLGNESSPTLSHDGRWLTYLSERSNSFNVWLKDLQTGQERQVTFPPRRAFGLVPDPLGRWVAYHETPEAPRRYPNAFRLSLKDASVSPLCEACTYFGETADGSFRLQMGLDQAVTVWNREKRTGVPIVKPEGPAENSGFAGAMISPDEKWMLLLSVGPNERQIFTVPFLTGTTVPRSDWNAVTKKEERALAPVWSPGGQLIYYLTRTGSGENRIMAVRIREGKPIGDPFLVLRFEGMAKRLIHGYGGMRSFNVAANRLVFTAIQSKGEIWLQR